MNKKLFALDLLAALAVPFASFAGSGFAGATLPRHETPQWYKDAKFGIFCHWGPQCIPEAGDWYAREMYFPGNWRNTIHKDRYGDPKEFGFKDLLPLWKAEKWNPQELCSLFARMGARYVQAMGNHHDNFDMWDSTYQPWNSVNMGPKKDILKGWSEAARANGMRFGVSIHAAHAWSWMNSSRYGDGLAAKEDGKGKWWEGYDPQDLYVQAGHEPNRGWEQPGGIHGQWQWANGADRPSEKFMEGIYRRSIEAVTKYGADLIYFDDSVLPFHPIADWGWRIVREFYAANPDAVATGKDLDDEQKRYLTWDVERGTPPTAMPEHWQTDTCIGSWHYDRGIYDRNGYKSAAYVLRLLVDVVSKNGNLCLSIPIRADGSIDEKERAICEDIAAWMKVNGEGIHDTVPWKVCGEGPQLDKAAEIKGFNFNEGRIPPATAGDFRYTASKDGKTVYAFALVPPPEGATPDFKALSREDVKSMTRLAQVKDFPACWKVVLGNGGRETGNELTKSTRKVFPDNAFREVPGEYLRPCDKPGNVVKFTYTTRDNQRSGSADYTKDCMVYLPYGYDSDKAKRYDILYLMHGGGGKITDYIGDGAANVPPYKHMLDHMIAKGELAPLIVCSLTYNTPYCHDATKNCVDFHYELRKDVIPAIESAFRTYAANVTPAELARTRWHRGFSGFSMGACATWAVFGKMIDCIACYIPTSGDCWTYGRGDFAKTARCLASDLSVKGVGPDDFRVYSGAGRTDIALPNLTPLVDEMCKIDAMFKYCDNFASGNLYKMVFEKGGHDFGTILNVAYNGLPKIFDTEPLSPAVEPPAPCGPQPNERQLWWQDLETYAFIHYSLNTYTDQEWGYGNEDPKIFNPAKLDARQWARVCRESGMKGAILTAKHHCGFCLWPSKYTDYSVKSSPWKNGKGDVVREFADACRAEGIKFAVYLSPWDRNHPEYGRPAYVEYFRNQLKELLTEYGDVFEVWFDGANGGNGWYGGANETRRIDKSYYGWEETFKMIRKWQPKALIWNDGGARGDLRWIGNEAGCCGERNWSLLNATGDVPGWELNSGKEDGDSWVPGETNTSIRPGWFHHCAEDGHVKSLSKLMDIYYKSVGRNSTLLLNFPIAPDGLIPEEDAKRGAAFAKAVKEAFKKDLAKGAKATADNVRGNDAAYSAANAVDGNPKTYWATDDGVTRAALTIDFGKETTFNRVVACEYIRLGQRVRRFSMEAFVNGEWREIRDTLGGHDSQTTVGRKRILCVPATTATKLRFTVLDAKACPLISSLGVYNAPAITADIPDSGEKLCGKYHVFFAGPRQMNIDLGGVKKISGFRYKPPQDGKKGIVTHYKLSSTVNWAKWNELASGEFSNVVNNPIWQTVKFQPVDAGIVSFTAERLAEGDRLRYDDFELLFEK